MRVVTEIEKVKIFDGVWAKEAGTTMLFPAPDPAETTNNRPCDLKAAAMSGGSSPDMGAHRSFGRLRRSSGTLRLACALNFRITSC